MPNGLVSHKTVSSLSFLGCRQNGISGLPGMDPCYRLCNVVLYNIFFGHLRKDKRGILLVISLSLTIHKKNYFYRELTSLEASIEN